MDLHLLKKKLLGIKNNYKYLHIRRIKTILLTHNGLKSRICLIVHGTDFQKLNLSF